MVLIIGSVVVIVSVVAGLAIGGGSIMVLAHASEFVTILGIGLGVMIIASPISTLIGICQKTIVALKGGPLRKPPMWRASRCCTAILCWPEKRDYLL